MGNQVRVYDWPLATLENRVFIMRELLERCEEEGYQVIEQLPDEEDPFWDPVQPERLIGVAQSSLQGLLSQVENQHECRILSTEIVGVGQDGKLGPHHVGTLSVEIWPCAKDGTRGVLDEEIVDDSKDLLASSMEALVRVVRAKGLPQDLSNDVRVEYDFFIDEAPHQVPAFAGHCQDPEFNYEMKFTQIVTSRFLNHCANKAIVFRVYGFSAEARAIQSETAVAAKLREQPTPTRSRTDGAGTPRLTPRRTTPRTTPRDNSRGAAQDNCRTTPRTTPQTAPEPQAHDRPAVKTPSEDVARFQESAAESASDPKVPAASAETKAPLETPASPPKKEVQEPGPLSPAPPTLSEVRRETEKAIASADTAENSSASDKKSKACSLL